jgi:hypothetical protein
LIVIDAGVILSVHLDVGRQSWSNLANRLQGSTTLRHQTSLTNELQYLLYNIERNI